MLNTAENSVGFLSMNKSELVNMLTLRIIFMLLITLLVLVGCGDNHSTNQKQLADKQNDYVIGSEVLVTVEGHKITRSDLGFMVEKTFSTVESLHINKEVQSKVLESLIAARAMRHVIATDLSDKEQRQIENQINAYTEELYIKAYLTRYALPEPVTAKMVKAYYAANTEEFGANEIKLFEMLKTTKRLAADERDRLLTKLPQIKQSVTWPLLVKNELYEWDMQYFKSKMQPGLLDRQLEIAIRKLAVGEISDVILIDGVLHFLRVIDSEQIQAKPLASVRAIIRKKLAALQLKKAVRQAAVDAVNQANIIYSTER